MARRCGTVLAAGRAAVGLVALTRPALLARGWVGAEPAAGPAGVVLGRAAGGRDLALGAGGLLAASRGQPAALVSWTVAGSFCDLVDVVTTLAAWHRLPARGRIAVAALAAGGAGFGAVTALLARQP